MVDDTFFHSYGSTTIDEEKEAQQQQQQRRRPHRNHAADAATSSSSSAEHADPDPETQPFLATLVRKISEPFLLHGANGLDGGGAAAADGDEDNNNNAIFSDLVRKLSEPILEDLAILRHSSFHLNEEQLLRHNRLLPTDADADADAAAGRRGGGGFFVGTATIYSEVANMTKNLIGGGVLSLSGGIAVYSNNPAAIFPAILWTACFGSILGYFCLL